MPRNIEIKASVKDASSTEELVRKLADSLEPTLLNQEDVFFRVSTGRLKLRTQESKPSQLIFYNRPDTAAPKLSDFHISPTDDPRGLCTVLSAAMGELGRVRKTRKLYSIGQTRVHLDCVEGLGDFLELEVVLTDEQLVEDGQKIAEDLMLKLDINDKDLVTCAYMDLILAQGAKQTK